ncbi:MAG: NADH-quinone oxidoreductase subunit N, partial [Rhodospirillales bacterium 20-64-7]
MALLMFGVLAKRDETTSCTAGAILLLALAAALSFSSPAGYLFGHLLRINTFTRYADMVVYLSAAVALLLSLDYNRREAIGRFEFPVLVLFSVLGMLVMISAADLMALYVGFELQSLALYICAAMARDSLRSTEAGLKYFVLGALASGLLIYGISLVYGFAGTTDFASLAVILADHAGYGTVIGIVFVLVGLAFKISAAPFHMWTPDVYEGAPTPVTAFFGTAPKVATMALLLAVMIGPFGHLVLQWRSLIQILSIVSMALGSLAAIGQSNIKRLMAYSSIGHMGYALIGLAAGTAAGVQATLVYLAVYVVMSFGGFACIIAMRRRGQAVETIADLAGLSSEKPGFAL